MGISEKSVWPGRLEPVRVGPRDGNGKDTATSADLSLKRPEKPPTPDPRSHAGLPWNPVQSNRGEVQDPRSVSGLCHPSPRPPR